MAIETELRVKSIWELVLTELGKEVIKKEAKTIILHARGNVVRSYEKGGYKVSKQSHTLFESVSNFLRGKTIERR